MANAYKWGVNPIQDFLVRSTIYGVDISDRKFKNEISSTIMFMIDNFMGNDEDSSHLDFEIKKQSDGIKIIGENAISAMWLSGIFPINVDDVVNSNKFIIENKEYVFNKKEKKLTCRDIIN